MVTDTQVERRMLQANIDKEVLKEVDSVRVDAKCSRQEMVERLLILGLGLYRSSDKK